MGKSRFPADTQFAVFDRNTQRCKRTTAVERPAELADLVGHRSDEVYVVAIPDGDQRKLAVIDTSKGDIQTVIAQLENELD